MPGVLEKPLQKPLLNALIEGLPRKDRVAVLASCETVELVFGQTLCEPDRPYRHVYFPLSGCISLVAAVAGHLPLELGMIGREGVLGATLVLDIGVAPVCATVQGEGTALRLSVARLRGALRGSAALSGALKRYVYVSMAQLSQTSICARFHPVEARLARWLLMMHDRADGDHLHLKHEFLAGMLGVRRSAVTIAAGVLQQRAIIHYSRGDITVVDRQALEAASCECYAAVLADYAKLLSLRDRH